jgi:phosphoenolpyruvate-protein kinase (PTS system EI component)
MNLIIREGKSWPFEKEFETLEEYRAYFLSTTTTAFVVRALDNGADADMPTVSLLLRVIYLDAFT